MQTEINYEEVLEECKNGKVAEKLKILYQYPYRNNVQWSLFPQWARPDFETEGGHEG